MPDFKIHLVPLTVAPVLVFVVITVLNIIGNTLKGLAYNNGVIDVWISLWNAYVCASSGACRLYDNRDLSDLVGLSSECESLVSHYRATEAFAIISTFFAGVLVIFSILLVIHQEQIGFQRVAVRGMVISAIMFVLDLITFILYITMKDRKCITSVASVALKPAPFMYLGGFVLSMVNIVIYLRMKQVLGAQLDQSPSASTRYTPSSASVVPQPQQFVQPSPKQRSPDRSVQMQPATFSPGITITAEQQQRTLSPIRVRSPVTSATRLRSPVSTGDGLWPDGDDWQVDEPSGLLWSETKHLFFDRSSGQFFDPRSDQWYDPEADRWYKLQK